MHRLYISSRISLNISSDRAGQARVCRVHSGPFFHIFFKIVSTLTDNFYISYILEVGYGSMVSIGSIW